MHVSTSTFVPKPHTPFQWLPLADLDTVERRQQMLRERLRGRGLQFSWTAPTTTLLEAVLGRGDRRLSAVIEQAWRGGAVFDAWAEHFRPGVWEQAFRSAGMEMQALAQRERGRDEVFPWEHISVGVSRDYLEAERERAERGEPTPDCREGCRRCGVLEAFATQRRLAAKGVWQCP